ncbi:hypothetical protein OG611_22330 [Streptomyces sp. NBC_01363]|nr:hypothetical protein [Streptomyces sp. NBC_01363]MCX4733686.1 hypothetical protein [Streptomyces sp. NBC_01363]
MSSPRAREARRDDAYANHCRRYGTGITRRGGRGGVRRSAYAQSRTAARTGGRSARSPATKEALKERQQPRRHAAEATRSRSM